MKQPSAATIRHGREHRLLELSETLSPTTPRGRLLRELFVHYWDCPKCDITADDAKPCAGAVALARLIGPSVSVSPGSSLA
jgi:hypothetical protein